MSASDTPAHARKPSKTAEWRACCEQCCCWACMLTMVHHLLVRRPRSGFNRKLCSTSMRGCSYACHTLQEARTSQPEACVRSVCCVGVGSLCCKPMPSASGWCMVISTAVCWCCCCCDGLLQVICLSSSWQAWPPCRRQQARQQQQLQPV
jgi:hypothetical protein